MVRTITIDGKEVNFKATAATPRVYRLKFGRDLFADMQKLAQSNKKGAYDKYDLTVFENIAFIMAMQADPRVNDINTWLDDFSMFSIYDILPEILEMWQINQFTLAESKKKIQKIVNGN